VGDVRGGLDDALEKLARRDELRRRAAGQSAGTPPAVSELVEAVAAVVARNPELAITMGVEGAGDPVLLTFAVDDGIVQVSADNPLTAQVTDDVPGGHRHADFDLDLDPEPEPDLIEVDLSDSHLSDSHLSDSHLDDPHLGGPTPPDTRPVEDEPAFAETTWRSDLFADEPAAPARPAYADDPYASERDPYADDRGHEDTLSYNKKFGRPEPVYETPVAYEEPTAFGRPQARPEPVAPQSGMVPPQTRGARDLDDEPVQRQMPAPMPTPMPLRVEPEVTELAAKRLAAMLREDPSLLQPNHPHD
jgi:hypothetical protein